jgi:hypothetical protein
MFEKVIQVEQFQVVSIVDGQAPGKQTEQLGLLQQVRRRHQVQGL